MDPRTVVPIGPALGVARFVLLVIAAAGFLAMHGVAATDAAGRHHSPLGMPAMNMTDPARDMGALTDLVTPASEPSAVAHCGGSNGQDMMTACLFVLLAALAAIALRALRNGLGVTPPATLRTSRQRSNPARAPPRPVFLSLCVFRL